MTMQHYYYSRLKLAGLTIAVAAILVAPGVMCIVHDYQDSAQRLFFAVISSGFFLLGALAVAKFVKVCVDHKPVVTITDEGIVDTRVSRNLIPWTIVKTVQFSGGRDRTIQLHLTPGARKTLRFRKAAYLYTTFLGVIGIASGPLAVRDSVLLRAIESRIERSRAVAGLAGGNVGGAVNGS